jgi:DNA-binding CsgD family transcriptional regulator
VTFEESYGLFHDGTVEALSAKILNRINAFICVIDVQELKFLWINRYFVNKTGFSATALLNMASSEMLGHVHQDYRELLVQMIQDFHNGNNGNPDCFFKIRTKGNGWIWISSAFNVYERNDDGQISKILSFATTVDVDQLYCRLTGLIRQNKSPNVTGTDKLLSDREKGVIQLIAGGNSDKKIAEILGISIHTSKTHRKNILRKIGLKNSSSLIKYAVENGLC